MRKTFIFVLLVILIFSSFAMAYADELDTPISSPEIPDAGVGSGVAAPVTTDIPITSHTPGAGGNVGLWEGDYSPESVLNIPNVSTEDLIERVNTKGNDIILILQTVGRYLCFFGFIICCVMVVIGVIGNRQMLTGALIGLIVCGVMYAGITCGKEIVQYIAAWAKS